MNEEADSKNLQRVADYCQKHGFTDPFRQDGHWWAFPPHGVIPIRLPIGNTTGPLSPIPERMSISFGLFLWVAHLIIGSTLIIPLNHQAIKSSSSIFVAIVWIYATIYGLYLGLSIRNFHSLYNTGTLENVRLLAVVVMICGLLGFIPALLQAASFFIS